MGKGWKQSGVLPERKKISRNDKVLKLAVPAAWQGAKRDVRGFEATEGRKASKNAIFG